MLDMLKVWAQSLASKGAPSRIKNTTKIPTNEPKSQGKGPFLGTHLLDTGLPTFTLAFTTFVITLGLLCNSQGRAGNSLQALLAVVHTQPTASLKNQQAKH